MVITVVVQFGVFNVVKTERKIGVNRRRIWTFPLPETAHTIEITKSTTNPVATIVEYVVWLLCAGTTLSAFTTTVIVFYWGQLSCTLYSSIPRFVVPSALCIRRHWLGCFRGKNYCNSGVIGNFVVPEQYEDTRWNKK